MMSDTRSLFKYNFKMIKKMYCVVKSVTPKNGNNKTFFIITRLDVFKIV